jgi:tripartite-type tricarboxylate transporter receptor subunit TctC
MHRYGLGAPKNTPVEVIEKLNIEIYAVLADRSIKRRLGGLGGDVLSGPPALFRKLMADDVEKWGNVIRAGNIKPQ